jgi:hypothetical protein
MPVRKFDRLGEDGYACSRTARGLEIRGGVLMLMLAGKASKFATMQNSVRTQLKDHYTSGLQVRQNRDASCNSPEEARYSHCRVCGLAHSMRYLFRSFSILRLLMIFPCRKTSLSFACAFLDSTMRQMVAHWCLLAYLRKFHFFSRVSY